MPDAIDNQREWEDPSLASWYGTFDHLFAPERTILETLGPRLAEMSMLDIGVGAGRTSLHFAGLVRRYDAIDYSTAMIAECRRRLPDVGSFHVADARDLSLFADATFDFVLFSFNGIDNLGFDDRDRALREISRVLRGGGVFAFSTHNLEFLERIWPPSRGVVGKWLDNRRRRRLLPAGRGVLTHHVRGATLPQAYIRHDLQRDALVALGARDIRLLSTWDGSFIAEDRLVSEPWLNYLCDF